MKMNKILGIFAIFALLMVSSAFAAVITEVEIENDAYVNGDILGVELGDNLDIEIDVDSTENLTDVEITARIAGYEYSDKTYKTYDVVAIDRIKEGVKKTYNLNVEIPTDMDEDEYALIIEVYTRSGRVQDFMFDLDVDYTNDEQIVIKRVNFDPAQVIAGRALRTTVKLENYGQDDANDIYVKVAIPGLGAGAYITADVDEIESGDAETTEDLLLRIPSCAKAGVYDVVVTAVYDNDHEEDEVVEQMTILENDACVAAAAVEETVDKTIVTPPQSQEIVAGAAGTSFPLMIKNAGSEDKTYLVTVSGVESWGTVEVSSSASFVRAGNTEVVYVYVSSDASVVGMKTFVVTVSDGVEETDMAVQVRVLPAEDSANAKLWIYGIIIALLVLIVILGLAVGFKKLNSGDEEEYY